MSGHGYARYTHGCRCGVCTTAKAEYMRAKRADAARRRRLAEADGRGRSFVPHIRHGYSGYQNHHCRCDECRAARAAHDAKRQRREGAA